MLNEKQSINYFLLGCVPARMAIVLVTRYLNKKYLPNIAIIFFIIGLSFLYLYLTNSRIDAPEGGGVTWWHEYRKIHGFLYVVGSIMCYEKKDTAWVPFAIDLLVGIYAFKEKRFP